MGKHSLYQYGTIGSLMAGAMDGTGTIKEFLTHGDFGIGTMDGVDGELIVLDQKAYKASATGDVIELQDVDKLPYGAIAFFNADHTFTISDTLANEAVEEQVIAAMKSKNLFVGVKISGVFDTMHVRAMPKQTPPYIRFSEVEQPEFTAHNIKGTIVGFYSPVLFHGTSVAGFHVHFISDDRMFGGHVLDYHVEDVTVEVQNYSELIQDFPKEDVFLDADFDYSNIAEEISISE
ncbi:acetolactate decarboxylase [uncultured Enterococcus sp.]|uniref:acetolactate decarboxylase n=1 Tax=uncultured Enterococcus sp. TaxID=167972 RepID=UPI0025F641F9|nr:acetolactate decarboxylase [uncultured Enterococcus sp.]